MCCRPWAGLGTFLSDPIPDLCPDILTVLGAGTHAQTLPHSERLVGPCSCDSIEHCCSYSQTAVRSCLAEK